MPPATDLADVIELELGEQRARRSRVARVGIDVVQVEHQAAAAFTAERVEKVGSSISHAGMSK
jgi:hypothetical protein